jgi:DNA-binding NarL/FixJ family response regulator
VVIADDAEDIRYLLRLVVESHEGYEVVGEAGDGREAVDLVASHQPELILLDVSMPVMDGLEAIPLIREASRETKILMVSGLDASYVEAAARELGANGYLEKGISPKELIREISALCP